MPIYKTEDEEEKIKSRQIKRNKLITAAKNGDESAIEDLTLDDMDLYTTISKKIKYEDVFSLVDSYFMPYGVECDQYSIMGEIKEVSKKRNRITGENIYVMNVKCNELVLDVCINDQDLLGEPMPGRRFKGTIWLQGYINYPHET